MRILMNATCSGDSDHCNNERSPSREPTFDAIQKGDHMWRTLWVDDCSLFVQNGSYAQRKALVTEKETIAFC